MKKRIFLTGAGGTMGGAALKELLQPERKGEMEIVVLDLPTEGNKKRLGPYEGMQNVRLVWGDLTNYDDVLKGVSGADVVLHAAAFIPPAADHDPDNAWRVNYGSASNIVQAIKAQNDPDAIRLVFVGSVAQTGDRLPPIHVGRTGDPILPSVFDMYACAKTAAERAVAESGLKYWVSLRQTFILTMNDMIDPIMFHPPLNTCLELCFPETAGLVLANACSDDLPEDFWRRFYNISSGSYTQVTLLEHTKKSLAANGLKLEEISERKWFTLRNFHSHWYEDAHVLDEYLHHQGASYDEFLRKLNANTPFLQKLLSRLTPPSVMKRRIFEPVARATPDATQYWIENDVKLRIAAFYKDLETYKRIPEWGVDMPEYPDRNDYVRLDHGYDEDKPIEEIDLADIQGAARFRGGVCVSQNMIKGDLFTKLRWKCAFDHEFEMSPNTILKGGHWCPECSPPGWNYDEQARHSPFIAQVWYQHHDRDENNLYPPDCVYDLVKTK